METLDKPAVVFFSIFDWWYHSHGHSDFQLALALAKSHRLLFVNSIGMRLPMPGRTPRPLRRIWRKIRSTARLVQTPLAEIPTLQVFTPLSIPVHGARHIAEFNSLIVSLQIRSLTKRMGMKDPVRIFTPPTALPVLQRVGRGPLIYNRSDNHGAFHGVGQRVAALEKIALAVSDVVAYSSPSLAAEERSTVGARAVLLEHAIDSALFHPHAEPDPEIAAIAGFKIGFCGDLREHVIDLGLIGRVADAIPDATFILVGDQTSSISGLLCHSNIRVLPSRTYEQMPGCWNALDAAIMPYRRTRWTMGCQPIKLNEILAVGLPIVGTDIPALVRLGPRAATASTPEGLIAATRRLVDASRTKHRTDPAPWTGPSWDEQARRLIGSVKGCRNVKGQTDDRGEL